MKTFTVHIGGSAMGLLNCFIVSSDGTYTCWTENTAGEAILGTRTVGKWRWDVNEKQLVLQHDSDRKDQAWMPMMYPEITKAYLAEMSLEAFE